LTSYTEEDRDNVPGLPTAVRADMLSK